MTSAVVDDASFRDPSGHVYNLDGRILRTITDVAVPAYEQIRDQGLLAELAENGQLISCVEIDPAATPLQGDGVRYVVEHPRLPFISYPYEWPFPLLKTAALFHLDFQLDLLDRGATLSDATAYNVQFDGIKPIFIDLLSLRPYRDGEYWLGHRQYTEQFLNPLLLMALLGVPYHGWYRGNLEGIGTVELARLIPARHKFNWRVLTQIVLPARFQLKALMAGESKSVERIKRRALPHSAYRGILTQLRNWVARLDPAGSGPSVWGDYAETHTYSGDDEEAKRRFVSEFAQATKPEMLWDLGCNTGEYSEVALSAGAKRVIGFDFDQNALNRAYQRASDKSLPLLPLFLDAANPSPAQGWRQRERQGFAQRAAADAVLALAFEHHLTIGRNVPIPQFIEWLTGLAPRGVVEFVDKTDSTVQRMLSLREDIFADYDGDHFEAALSTRARIIKSAQLSTGGRRLYWYEILADHG